MPPFRPCQTIALFFIAAWEAGPVCGKMVLFRSSRGKRVRLTPLILLLLSQEFKRYLLNGRVSHVAQFSEEGVELTLYHPDRRIFYLTAVLTPQKPFLFMGAQKRAAMAKPPNFCRSLRKHLDYAQISEIEQEPGERLITFHLKAPHGLYRLVFEGLSKYPNLILVGPDGQIISAMRYKNEAERPVLPQAPYGPPPQPLEKPNLWTLDEDTFQKLWEDAGKPPLGAWFKTHFRGTDPELSAHLEGLGPKAFSHWTALRRLFIEKGWDSFAVFPGASPSLRLFAVSPEQGGKSPGAGEGEAAIFSSPSEAMDELFQLENHNRILSQEKTRIESEINKALKHEKRISEKLKKDRVEAEKSDQYQWWGELLMAQLHKLKPHLPQVELEDVVRGGPSRVTIPLDPEATPLLNAQRFFKKSRKGSRGLALVEKREKEIEERIHQLKSAQRSLPALLTADEIRKARLELFPVKKEIREKALKPKEPKIPTPNIIREKINAQFELCAGTSATANEYVTFQLAQPEDLWFHVRDLPGSHVILRRLRRDAVYTDALILQAAHLAATRSKAQAGAKITVSYTEKKYVKKIPGAPTGMVSMTKERSILIQL
jgi:predicted ribosome quality control (RQC) complex YloA/Tae2 family protein